MARSLSKSAATPQARQRSALFVLPQLPALWPALLLAVLTVAALVAVYAVRPVVQIDMGGDFDAAFVRDFNAREVDTDGASDSYTWAAGEDALTLPGNREGIWIVTLNAAEGQSADVLRSAAVAVNGIRVDMPRRTATTIVAEISPDIAADSKWAITLVSPLIGGLEPPQGIVGEVTLAPARTYRWSQGESSIVLPNLGRGAWNIDLSLVASHPDGSAVDAQVLANGALLANVPEANEPRRVHLFVPAALMDDGNLKLTLRSNTFSDPRSLGVLVSDVAITPVRGAVATALPPLRALSYGLVTVLGLYTCLWLMTGNREPWTGNKAALWRTLAVVLSTAAVVVAGGWVLAAFRFPSSFMLPRLAALSAGSLLLLLVLRPLLARAFRVAKLPIATERLGGFFNLLLLIFFVSFWLKMIGVLYPYFVAIDIGWHIERSKWILNGQLPLLYGVNSPLNESTMPTAEWGSNRPTIPYSPYFHMLAALFVLVPLPMTMTANIFSVLIDSSRVLLIALLACKIGLSKRTALWAALMYAVLPVAFMLHSWGNIPTTFGLWLTLATTVVMVVAWERLHERVPMVVLSVALLITFLMYTVTAVFMGLFLVVFTALVWLNGLRGGGWRTLVPQLRALWIATGVAMAMALVIYYGQYVPQIISRTIPYMTTVFAQGPESVGVERPPLGEYLWTYVPHLDYRIWPGDYLFYGVAIPVLFTIPGFVALRRKPLAWVTFAAWGVVALLFMLAGYRISMVDKQLFYLLPVICICWAIYADRFWERGRWGKLFVVAIYVFSLAAALDQWVLRIVTSPTV